MDHVALHERARAKGANLPVYWFVRAFFQPFFHIYFRMRRIGREHIPKQGPVIVAANHRSFLDPFVIATMARRPMYYVAKKELFRRPWQAWILNALGAFPVDRGAGDADTIRTAKAMLARGEIVLIFPEGTRTRPGALGKPHNGRRAAGAGDRCAGRPGRGDRHGGDSEGLENPSPQGADPRRPRAALPPGA